MFSPLAAQPDVQAIETEVGEFWRTENIFRKSLAQRQGAPQFVVYDGPPTANAKPALHHAIPGSFKDLVGRYQTMRGRYVRRQAGWDTHGLPVEVQVEKKLGLSGKRDVLNLVPGDERASIAKFNEICRTSVWEFKQDWERFLGLEGYWTDTETPYITYDPMYVEGVWGVLKQVWERGLVYKGYRVSPYCPRCGTSLSAIEVADGYQDVKDVSVFVAFPLVNNSKRSLLAWTTTPWTLPGNTALAINPNLKYVAVLQNGREYVLAKSRLEVLVGEYEILEEVSADSLIGTQYIPPFNSVLTSDGLKQIVVRADFVTDTDGTGIVHLAPMYGEDDFNVGQANNLVMQHTVGLDGNFFVNVTVVGGLYIRDALGKILTHLKESGSLYAKKSITHSYPHCWRCKTALLYYAKDSWFIGMSKLRDELVRSNASVNWVPEHIKEGRFGDFIREARDWSISRERFWGTPLPIWTNEVGDVLCVGSFKELKALAEVPSLVGESFDPHRPQVDEIVLIKDGVRYTREPLVMDVWFDSGSMPYASGRLGRGEFPADYIAEAVDQTRGWFYSLMALGTVLKDESPYRTVVCMGHLVDEQGKKMSKSIGNIFDPVEMIEKYGADSLRWFFYTVNSPGETKSFNVNDVQTGFRKTLLLTYNMVKYWQTYSVAAEAGGKLQYLDSWALAEEAQTIQEVTDYLDEYDFMRAGRVLERHISDLSTWYLRRSRDRNDAAFYAFFADRLKKLLVLLAPFTPFMSEYLYGFLRSEQEPESIHLCDWPIHAELQPEVLRGMSELRGVVELGQSLRAEAKIKIRQPLRALYVSAPLFQESWKQLLQDELNVVEVINGESPISHPSRTSEELGVALDTQLDDSLLAAGQAREVLRQLQNLRKQYGLRPGQQAELRAGPFAKGALGGLFEEFPKILEDTNISVTEATWARAGDSPIQLNGETLYVSLH